MEKAYQYLKVNILNGQLRPSQKVIETELSEQIGVSRNTIKKALLKLEQENLITMEKNKGAYVTSFTLQQVLNYLEIREELEVLVAKHALVNIGPNIEHLHKYLLNMKVFVKESKLDEYSKMNKAFHQIIYDASNKPEAVDMITVIKTQLQRHDFRTILVPGRIQSSLEEHQNIYEALKNKDEAMLEKNLRLHLSQIRDTINQNYNLFV
ncbi:GntR family transcriptional regulator [Psychrobacillus sp. NPDC096389]|uniref:GntR family transcriptional regulator n=1 Tax=Psychrobacillus sp. NPDC096389 TaxID=3364490 RepID=UPI0038285419